MAQEHDLDALREVLRQGERTLFIQQEFRESALRRTGELLRLSVATLAGVVVVGGLLSTAHARVGAWPLAFITTGTLFVVLSTMMLAVVLVGRGPFGNFASGPDFQRIVVQMDEGRLRSPVLFAALVRNVPEWITENEGMFATIQQWKGSALLLLTSGSLILLGTILYILLGAIS